MPKPKLIKPFLAPAPLFTKPKPNKPKAKPTPIALVEPPASNEPSTEPSNKPRGRPKASMSARATATELIPHAYRALKAAMKKPGERVGAANTVLAYALGKPQTNTTIRIIHSMADLSEAELRALAGLSPDEPLTLGLDADDDSKDDDEPFDNAP
jgi:hypothetical protein